MDFFPSLKSDFAADKSSFDFSEAIILADVRGDLMLVKNGFRFDFHLHLGIPDDEIGVEAGSDLSLFLSEIYQLLPGSHSTSARISCRVRPRFLPQSKLQAAKIEAPRSAPCAGEVARFKNLQVQVHGE